MNQFVADAAPSVTHVVKVFTLGACPAVGVQVMLPWLGGEVNPLRGCFTRQSVATHQPGTGHNVPADRNITDSVSAIHGGC